jgi:hypothetical protein
VKAPKFIAGQTNAIVMCAMQIGLALMTTDAIAMSDRKCIEWCATIIAVVTLSLGLNLAAHAASRGFHSAWGLFALLGLAGFAVVYCLPHRAREPAGFPVAPFDKTQAR